jgi:hypothetical protein
MASRRRGNQRFRAATSRETSHKAGLAVMRLERFLDQGVPLLNPYRLLAQELNPPPPVHAMTAVRSASSYIQILAGVKSLSVGETRQTFGERFARTGCVEIARTKQSPTPSRGQQRRPCFSTRRGGIKPGNGFQTLQSKDPLIVVGFGAARTAVVRVGVPHLMASTATLQNSARACRPSQIRLGGLGEGYTST